MFLGDQKVNMKLSKISYILILLISSGISAKEGRYPFDVSFSIVKEHGKMNECVYSGDTKVSELKWNYNSMHYFQLN